MTEQNPELRPGAGRAAMPGDFGVHTRAGTGRRLALLTRKGAAT